MNPANEDKIDEFINALQLSIISTIGSWTDEDDDESFSILFSKIGKNDFGLELFEKLNLGQWNAERTSYKMKFSDNIASVTSFLMLSRLSQGNISKLAEINVKYQELASQMGLVALGELMSTIGSVEDVKKIIFDKIKQRGMTLRQLSEKTGLSQTALSNFKSGNDIRLSNLIIITKALGLKIKIT